MMTKKKLSFEFEEHLAVSFTTFMNVYIDKNSFDDAQKYHEMKDVKIFFVIRPDIADYRPFQNQNWISQQSSLHHIRENGMSKLPVNETV